MEQTLKLDASIENPEDPTEVNVIAHAVSVGTNLNGVTWTADLLKAKAKTFIGQPVNIMLNAAGEATKHSKHVIGTIVDSWFDEGANKIGVKTSLWKHYFPETVDKVKDLYNKGKLGVSMEFKVKQKDLLANADGSVTPQDGRFAGLAFVDDPADLGQAVLLLAALDNDQKRVIADNNLLPEDNGKVVSETIKEIGRLLYGGESTNKPSTDDLIAQKKEQDDKNLELAAAHEGSFEWISRNLLEHLNANKGPEDYSYQFIIATYANHAIYQEGDKYFKINFKRNGSKINFADPEEVEPEYKPLNASIDGEESMEELQAARAERDEYKQKFTELEQKYTELEASVEKDRAAAREVEAERLANERVEEINKIAPYTSIEAKEAARGVFKTMEASAFDSFKTVLASTLPPKSGIASGNTIENPNADENVDPIEKEARENLDSWKTEIASHLGVSKGE